MTWVDRLAEAAFTSPLGERIAFQYASLPKERDHRGTAFEFPDVNGAYVQRKGVGPRTWVMKVYFSGSDHDLAAARFEAALEAPGFGTLEHPRDGIVTCTTLGKVTRDEAPATSGNVTVLTVGFMETIERLFPGATEGGTQKARDLLGAVNDATSQALADSVKAETPGEKFSFLQSYRDALDTVESWVKPLADLRADTARKFGRILDSVDAGISTLIDDPVTLAYQTLQLIQAPSTAHDDVSAQLEAYENLAASIISGDGAVRSPGNDNSNANAFYVDALLVAGAVSGAALSAANGAFGTKPEALSASERLGVMFDVAAKWRDANHDSLGVFDSSESYSALLDAVAETMGLLVGRSFSLAQERRITLESPRCYIELCAELYGDISDDRLLFFIESNELTGDEILELPKGRGVVYYV